MPTVKDLVKLFNLEVEEEFYIYDNYYKEQYNYVYKFSNHNLLFFEHGAWSSSNRRILDFFTGRYTIVKKPWKPKKGDKYYRISSHGSLLWTKWAEDIFDLTHFSAGNCFKTKEDAEKHKVALINSLKCTYNDFDNKEN